jgi:hypothetical protein
MPKHSGPENAEILGLEALTWLVCDQPGLDRFLAASGVDGAELREAAGSPGLTIAILDFLLANEDLLLAFCESSGTKPAGLHRARHALGP